MQNIWWNIQQRALSPDFTGFPYTGFSKAKIIEIHHILFINLSVNIVIGFIRMKKVVCLLVLNFLVLISFAQIRTTTYQGRTVKIFPYRIQVEYGINWSSEIYGYDYKTYFNEKGFDKYSVPYCPEKLEDGEYIIYYKPEYDYTELEKSIKQFAKGDTFFVAVNFKIKNGMKDGSAFFYDIKKLKRPVVKGYYTNDNKEGTWQLFNQVGTVTSNYRNGQLDGQTLIEFKKDKIKILKNFSEGLQDGLEQTYKGRELLEYKTFRKSERYGPYQEMGNKGFRIGEDLDSFTYVYNNNRLTMVIFNSPTPWPETDITEKQWRVDAGIRIQPRNGTYTKFYSINKAGQKSNNFYLIDGKMKIPFVMLNENGDTSFQTIRMEEGDSFIKYKTISKTFDKDNRLESINEKHITKYKHIYEYEKSYPPLSTKPQPRSEETQVSRFIYTPQTITKTFTINKPVEEYRGWIVKADSIVEIERKTGIVSSTKVNYTIKGIDEEFTTYTYLHRDGTTGSFSLPDFTILTKNDTLFITKKSYLANELYTSYTKKISLNDSNVIEGTDYLMNLDVMVYALDNIQYTGLVGYLVQYKEKPYTGTILLTRKLSRKTSPYSYNVEMKEKKKDLLIITTLEEKEKLFKKLKVALKSLFNTKSIPAIPYSTDKKDFPTTIELNYKDGKPHGLQRAQTNQGRLLFQLNFRNGVSHGSQWFPLTNMANLPVTNDGTLSQINYDSGRIDGYVTIRQNKEGQLKLFAKYTKDKLNGTYVEFDEAFPEIGPRPSIEAFFINDTLNGDLVISMFGIEKERIPFIKGKATGWYTKNRVQNVEAYQSDSLHHYQPYVITFNELKVKLNDGRIVDTAFAYFDNGQIKYKAIVDHGFHHRFIKQSGNGIPFIQKTITTDTLTDVLSDGPSSPDINFGVWAYNGREGIDLDPIYDNVNASFTFYYKNGVKSQQGKMRAGMKHGTWKYWAESGVLMKEIEYRPGIDSSTENIITYRGKIRGYYPDGNKMMEGLITDEELSYQCNQEVDVAYEEVYYLNFYDETGHPVLVNQTGRVQDYHLNGNKHFSGQIAKGMRSGLWKFYDPSGNLSAIGEYEDGLKQGKWLEGDLGGVNYIDNACTVNEALGMIREKQAKDIDITETLYERGGAVSSSHLLLEKF